MRYINNFMFYLGMPVWLLAVTLAWALQYVRWRDLRYTWMDAYKVFREMVLGE
jgi:hypothetical protein